MWKRRAVATHQPDENSRHRYRRSGETVWFESGGVKILSNVLTKGQVCNAPVRKAHARISNLKWCYMDMSSPDLTVESGSSRGSGTACNQRAWGSR